MPRRRLSGRSTSDIKSAVFNIREIAFTCYPVLDMARARGFYEAVLGLRPTLTHGEAGGMQWTEYAIGAGTLSLGCGAPGWKPRADGCSIALEMEDFEAAMAHLRARGIKFRMEPCTTPVCRMAFIEDTEGNTICIHQRKSK